MYSFHKISDIKTAGQRSARGRSPSLGLALFGRLGFLIGRSLLALFLDSAFERSQHDEHGAPLHLGRDLNGGHIGQGGGDLLQVFERDLRVVHFAAAELDRHPDFVSLQKPAAGIVHLEAAVGFVRLRAQADFLDLDLGLGFLCLAVLFGPFVDKLAVVDHTADGWIGVRRDLDQVQLGVACDLQGLADRYNTDIAAIRPDQADLRDADALINSKF